ncbi:preprotein translocase subunit SecG [Candidatus Peregrinibacteria bacterium]|mgnify:CR=1 FL=1|jgi:preprotein translocase subunit SecG|nr:preprotein translocase subunit SecG [Candidatus Peregrinibacteria bacterium]
MKAALIIIHLVVSILLCLAILLQNKGGGLGAAFGGGGEFHSTKRGAEKLLHNATILLVALFALLAITISLVAKYGL